MENIRARRTVTRRKRSYRMGARADAAEQTLLRIQDAALDLFCSRPFQEVTLHAIAEAAGVTLQTVLRRFGSKENVFTAAAKSRADTIFERRQVPVAGDPASIVESIVASYEEMGDLNWRGVQQEEQFPLVKRIFDTARARHRAWVEASFANVLADVRGDERERRVVLLFAATDFYMWKLFRRDLQLGRAATAARMLDIVRAHLADFRRPR
jgi:AcrR family transcriptional regulator